MIGDIPGRQYGVGGLLLMNHDGRRRKETHLGLKLGEREVGERDALHLSRLAGLEIIAHRHVPVSERALRIAQVIERERVRVVDVRG